MENAPDGCVKNQDGSATLSKPQIDDSKSKYTIPYVNKPIFRRKLIEKYSTARYNINTKRVLVRNSSASQTQCNDKISKASPKNASSLVDNVEKAKTSSGSELGSSNEVSIAALPSSCELACDRSSLNSVKSSTETENATSGTSISDERPGTSMEYASSSSGQREPRITSNGPPDSQSARKRKFTSAPVSTSGSKTMWKIAPKTVYNQLWDFYQSTVEVKAEEEPEPEPEPKKETKKRPKCVWTKKKTRKKPITVQETVVNKTRPDPYIECLKEADTQSPNTSHGQNSQKLGIIMYLGVNRPMFPLMYRNLRVLNDSKDATITDFWSEFALSTLVTKPTDKKCKPILVPVKDPELTAMVSECLDEALTSNVSTVSEAESANDDDVVENNVVSQVCVKQEENNDVPRKKRKYKPRQPKIPKTYGLRAKNYKKNEENEPGKISDDKSIIPIRGRPPIVKPSPTSVPFSPAPTPTSLLPPAPTPAPASTSTFANFSAPTSVTSPTPPSTTSPARSPTIAFTSPCVKPKPKDRAIRTNKRVIDEKALLKKFGYKECQVAIPKLSDTLIKYLSAGNYSNESAQLSDPTERELIEETDNFGLVQCTRTDGIIIDYVKRNRSLVYFYKLKKMLDFQKTNNKYFVCCDYMLIERSSAGESDENVDVISIKEDDDNCDEINKTASTTSGHLRHSRNPNDLFKTSKISEWKNKSYRISWVKNHDLKFVSDVRWLLISLDKHVASLSHTSGCVLRYRLLFEIIYRAELSKKVICCEVSSQSGSPASGSGGENDTSAGTKTSVNKLAFGVYAFPGLCDKVLAGPYLFHEDHQFSASIRMNDGSSEPAHIRTLEEKENFPQTDDSTPVKHINAKWWSGKKTVDPAEQYLNFFFNPSPVTCGQLTDKLCLTKIIAEHPCHNYHSYEITGRESNLVLFHDRRINHIERTVFTSIEPLTAIKTENKSDQAPKTAAPVIPPKSSINLRKKPRRDYSRLVTDDMAVPAKTKNLEFHIVDVKSLRKRRNAQNEAKLKRNRYHESPQTHIMNERMRRLEFRNRRNNLASVLEARPSSKSGGSSQSLVSILNQAKEIITYLEIDNDKLYEEGNRVRSEQSALMRKFLALLRNHDINSASYRKGNAFLASWKQIKSEHRRKLIDILGQNFDKQKANKSSESSRCGRMNVTDPTSIHRPIFNRSTRRPMPKKLTPESQSDELELTKRENQHSKEENTTQRSKFRQQKRQKMRNTLRKRNNLLERSMTDSFECGIGEEVVCENGKLSDPFGTNHILDRMGEVSIIVPNVPSNIDQHAVDPLANRDSDDASLPPDGKSIGKKKEMSHPLYLEHSYCSAEDEPVNKSSNAFDRRLPQIKSVFSQRVGYHPIRPFGNGYRAPVSSPMFPPYGYRPNRPIISSVTSLPQRKTIRTRMPVATASPSPSFQIRVSKSADENLGIDILDNGRMFARLNIAKVNNGNDPSGLASSSYDAGSGAAAASTSNKIMTIIQRFLLQMEKASPSTEANDDERAKQAKRKHVVNSLKSFISKFESRRQPAEDTGCSSSRASNSDDTSPSYVTDSIELESGYSSKSEESCDRDYESNTNEPTADGPTIENIVLDDDDDDDDLEIESQELVRVQEQDQEPEPEPEPEPVEIHIPETEERLRDEEFIAEEEEEEEIIGEEEFIEEEEEEEEIVGGGNTLEEMNDVDAAMRGDQVDCFEDSDDSTEGDAPLVIDDSTNIVVLDLENHRSDDEDKSFMLPKSTSKVLYTTKDGVPSTTDDSTNVVVLDLENHRPDDEEKRLLLPKSTPKVLYSTNQFTIIRSKNKFVPNIMKTPTKTIDAASVSDHLSRIQVKPSVGLVKLSTANMQITTNGVRPTRPSNDSIIKRLWYSPVTKADQENLKVLRRDSPLNEPVKSGGLKSDKSANEDNDEEADSKDETGPSIEKDNSGANRILIKSFANHDKFKEAFVSNVDKLLNPEL